MLIFALAIAGAAAGQAVPTAPSQGAQIEDASVVLRWALDPGWQTECVEWSARPETSYAGGPFLDPFGGDCTLGPQDVAYLLKDLAVERYYWHVEASRETCDPNTYECTDQEQWGPTAYFDSVEPPPPTGCTRAAANYVKNAVLLPYANAALPSLLPRDHRLVPHEKVVPRPRRRRRPGDGGAAELLHRRVDRALGDL